MGNKSSQLAVCGAPSVTANPTTAKLSERDVVSLHSLYGHDDELLQLMCAAELLRDSVKGVRDGSSQYFAAMRTAAKRGQEFGAKLAATADRHHTSGMTQSIPSENGDVDGPGPIAAAGGKRAVGDTSTQVPLLRKVIEVQTLIGEVR